MKISNSKKQLAKIISENGGWFSDGTFSIQDKDDCAVWFSYKKPSHKAGNDYWTCSKVDSITGVELLPNWHQTVLARDEYFHLYPAPDAVAEEPEHVWTNPPTIEQLAAEYRNRQDYAERKQQEADAAKADAEAKLAELVAAGKAVGLVVSVARLKPKLVITDWRDLREGDVIRCVGDAWDDDFEGSEAVVSGIESHDYKYEHRIRACIGEESDWGADFHFIRRPAKGDANA